MNRSPGRDRVQPVAMAAAASTADRLSPKQSGATSTRMVGLLLRSVRNVALKTMVFKPGLCNSADWAGLNTILPD